MADHYFNSYDRHKRGEGKYSNEKTTRVCRVCKLEKDWIYSHTIEYQGRRIYRDKDQNVWSGYTCYDCRNVAAFMRKKKDVL